MPHRKIAHKRSYTLIEMVVVIGVVIIVLPALFSIIITILQQQSKIYRLQEVKRQGDNALTVMENLIRNRARILAIAPDFSEASKICRDPTIQQTYGPFTSLYFKDETGNYFQLFLNGEKITSRSAILNTTTDYDLTGSKIQVETFSLSCTRRAEFTTPLVSVNFSLKYKDTAETNQNASSMNYQIKVKVRNE